MPFDGANAATSGKLLTLTARQLSRVLRLPGDQAAAAADMSVTALLCDLRDKGRLKSALRLAAHALPGREAVWWGAMCVEAGNTCAQLDSAQLAALRAVQAWVWRPGDDALASTAETAGQGCKGSAPEWLTLAIGFNRRMGGNRGFGAGVEGCVLRLAPVPDQPVKLDAWRRRFLGSALEIDAGGSGRIPGGLPA